MRRSAYFLPLLKQAPAEAQLVSHQLMLRAGMMYQAASGIYTWLPLGTRVLQNIERIVAEEMDRIGGQRIIMPTVQPADLWEETGRYGQYGDELLRIQDRNGRKMVYTPTAEEMVTDVGRTFLQSHKQLPQLLYQIHWKFRDEIRPRFGVMRGREFFMKDGYSFDATAEGAIERFEIVFDAYIRIFDRVLEGVTDAAGDPVRAIPVRADTGLIGGSLSYEFQIPADSGESDLFYDRAYHANHARTYHVLKDLYSAADDMHDPAKIPAEHLVSRKGIESGHLFYLGDKYSKAMKLKIATSQGQSVFAEMGCYGIGVSRLVAAAIEVSHDRFGIIWPKSIAPFQVGLINLLHDQPEIADEIYTRLCEKGVDVLYDDRTEPSIGAKLSEMDLIGVPFHILVTKKYLETGELEYKVRATGEKRFGSWEACWAALHEDA